MAVRLEMRVDMRRWVLVLCSIGVMGGGCSARALLGVGITTADGKTVTGAPVVVVEWGGDTVRTVRLPEMDVKGNAPAAFVGVYLDYEGSVHVSATVRTKDGCDWTGAKDTPVSRGARTDVTVVIAKGACAPDGGTPDAEAGVDGPGDAEVGPTLVGDAREDVVEKIATCSEYCALYLARCADWRETPLILGDCIALCNPWATGEAGSVVGNTLACRSTFLRAAVGPDLRCSMCPAASPESPGMCNALPPDAGPRGDCPIPPRDAGDAS